METHKKSISQNEKILAKHYVKNNSSKSKAKENLQEAVDALKDSCCLVVELYFADNVDNLTNADYKNIIVTFEDINGKIIASSSLTGGSHQYIKFPANAKFPYTIGVEFLAGLPSNIAFLTGSDGSLNSFSTATGVTYSVFPVQYAPTFILRTEPV